MSATSCLSVRRPRPALHPYLSDCPCPRLFLIPQWHHLIRHYEELVVVGVAVSLWVYHIHATRGKVISGGCRVDLGGSYLTGTCLHEPPNTLPLPSLFPTVTPHGHSLWVALAGCHG